MIPFQKLAVFAFYHTSSSFSSDHFGAWLKYVKVNLSPLEDALQSLYRLLLQVGMEVDVPPLPRLVRGVSNLASRTYLEVLQARDVYSQPRPTPPQQKPLILRARFSVRWHKLDPARDTDTHWCTSTNKSSCSYTTLAGLKGSCLTFVHSLVNRIVC